MTKVELRGDLLERAALEAAAAWTGACCTELKSQGRRVEGGWPGTIREARTRGAAEAARVLTKHAMTEVTRDELDRLARALYDQARRSWSKLAR